MGLVKNAEHRIEARLWPFVDHILRTWPVPGVAVCVVHSGDRVVARGFGTRETATGAPVTADTLFHLASVSKTFVASAVLQLVEVGELDLDAGITTYLPDLPWADPRAGTMTLRQLLSHQSGLGDVVDYGWHEPELDDEALSRFATRVAGWRLEHDPGSRFAYSNAGYELLGHLLATVRGKSFEHVLSQRVLEPLGMRTSTFLLADIPPHLGAGPHLGMPPAVVDGAYPYTRSHAPSSSLHSSATEMGRWMVAHLAGGAGLMSRTTHDLMWEAVAEPGWDDWHAQMALGWFRGTHRDHAVVGHPGTDPGFAVNLALLPDLGIGVTVLTNCNTAPLLTLTRAALDVLLGREPAAAPVPPVTVPLAPLLVQARMSTAAELYQRLAEADPRTVDVDEARFEDAVWGLIEMHRTDLARPLLDLWRRVQPESSGAWFMTGWAHDVDGRRVTAVEHLRRAVALDPDNDDAVTMLRRLQDGDGGPLH